jgi:hypothetical protein
MNRLLLMERSIDSAVAWWVTTARMRRGPPQGQRQTSTPKVRCSRVGGA